MPATLAYPTPAVNADARPPMLPPHALTVPGVPGTWCVAHVRHQGEKTLAADLMDAGYGFFLPLRRKVDRRPTGEAKGVRYLPLPGLDRYVFCAGAEPLAPGERVPRDLLEFLLSQRAVDNVIHVHAADQARLKREMSALHAAVVANPNMGCPDFVADQRARVTSGPFQGREAEIDTVAGRGRVVIPVTILGQVVALDIDMGCLEPV